MLKANPRCFASTFTLTQPGETPMNWAWRFGMVVLSGVPAIIGGGIIYGLTESWVAVAVWEAILVCLLVAVLIKGGKSDSNPHHVPMH